jgi:RNA polymerase sigma-70 factor (ECF subfamily)
VADQFLQVYEEHVWDVYGYFAYRALPVAEAEDLTQLTFERALRAWTRFDPQRASAKTWLLAIARNAYIDHRRRGRSTRSSSIDSDEVAEGDLPATAGPDADLGLDPELELAISRLGRREREVIALRFGGDLRGPEIAEMLDISLANAQQILSRALRKLHTALHELEHLGSDTNPGTARFAAERGSLRRH